jgi:hypothetical protein
VTPELDRLLEVCDPGIRKAVRMLWEAGVHTIQSCEGGADHTCAEPTVTFGCGRPEEGWKALSVCLENGPAGPLPTAGVEHRGRPSAPRWEIVFREQVPC